MKDYFSEKAIKEAYKDSIVYGTMFCKQKPRAWFNLIRYLMGVIKTVHVPMKEVYDLRLSINHQRVKECLTKQNSL